jgi:ferredoxin
MVKHTKITVDASKCMHCGACVGTCPKNAIFLNEVELVFNKDCVFCGICVKTCPVGALTMEK